MYKLNLNVRTASNQLTTLFKNWNDHSKVVRPLVIVKISEAFTMYHEIVTQDYEIENHKFKRVNPVFINDLENNFSLLLTLDEAGRTLHSYLIDDHSNLRRHDELLKFAHKNRHQEYLDYFYCISKNIQQHLNIRRLF